MPPRRSESPRRAHRARVVVVVLSLGVAAFTVVQSMLNPVMPELADELDVTANDASWILTSTVLAAAVLTPIFGRLGDLVGKRRVLLAVLAVFALGTVLAGVAGTLPLLIAGRVLQGAAAAVLPLSIGILRDLLPRERVGVAVGLISAIFGVGGGLGIVLAGPVVDHLTWHWLFWGVLVLIALAFVGVLVAVPESGVRAPGRIDLVGAGILSVALLATLLAVTKGGEWGWSSGRTIGLIAAGAVMLVVFVTVEWHRRSPLIDLRLLAIRGVWTTNLVALSFGFVMFMYFLAVPTLLELETSAGHGFGMTATAVGLFLVPNSVVMLVLGPVSGLLDRRFGPKVPLVLGSVLAMSAFAIPAVRHDSAPLMLVSCLLCGAGMGMAFAAMANAIIEAVPATHTGEATGVNTIVRMVGGAAGLAVTAAVLASSASTEGVPSDGAFTTTFWIGTAVGLGAVVAALLLPSARRRHEAAVAAGVEDLPPEPERIHLHVAHH